MKPKHPPFTPPGPAETPEVRALREAFERELEAVKVADAAVIKELQLHVRRLKTDLIYNGRVLAKTSGRLHELELERQERSTKRKRA